MAESDPLPSAAQRAAKLVAYLSLIAVSALVDWRVLRLSPVAAGLCCGAYGATLLFALIVACRPSASYWPHTLALVVYLLAGHVTALSAAFAASSADVDPLSGWHLARCIAVALGAVHYWGLKEAKAGGVVCAALIPLILMRPLLLLDPSSWASTHRSAALGLIAVEVPVCVAVALLASIGSRRAASALRETRSLLLELEYQAAQTQGLLEASMPPAIARALLEDVPPEELSAEVSSASIAFVALDEYAALAAASPLAALSWLDSVYVAFDALVDAYGERVNKIEVVANTYLLSTGLPLEAADHAHVMAAFAADLLALCRDVPGVGSVQARVGLHCGPVAAGFVGRSRRFYRVFGDTVNVASRMMSLGESGRIHMSAAFTAALQAGADTDALHGVVVSSATVPTEPGSATPQARAPVADLMFFPFSAPATKLLPPNARLAIERRGVIEVKGKGPCTTHWLVTKLPVIPSVEDTPRAPLASPAQHAVAIEPKLSAMGVGPVQLTVDTLPSVSSADDLVAAFDDGDPMRERRQFPAPATGAAPDAQILSSVSAAPRGILAQQSTSWRYVVAVNRVARGLSTIAEGPALAPEFSRSLDSGNSHSPHPASAVYAAQQQPQQRPPTLRQLPSALDLYARLSDHQRRDAGRVAQHYVDRVAGTSPIMHGRRSSGLRSLATTASQAHVARPDDASNGTRSPSAAPFAIETTLPGLVDGPHGGPAGHLHHADIETDASSLPSRRFSGAVPPGNGQPMATTVDLASQLLTTPANLKHAPGLDSAARRRVERDERGGAREAPFASSPAGALSASFALSTWSDGSRGDAQDCTAPRSSLLRLKTEGSELSAPRPPFALTIRAHARVTPEKGDVAQSPSTSGTLRCPDRDDGVPDSPVELPSDSLRCPPSPAGSSMTRGSGRPEGTAGSLTVSPQSLHDRVSNAASSIVMRPMRLAASTRSLGVSALRPSHAFLSHHGDVSVGLKMPSLGDRRRCVSEEVAVTGVTATSADTLPPRSVSPAARSLESAVDHSLARATSPHMPVADAFIVGAARLGVCRSVGSDRVAIGLDGRTSCERPDAIALPVGGFTMQRCVAAGVYSATGTPSEPCRSACTQLYDCVCYAIAGAKGALVVFTFADRAAERRVQVELQANLETSHATLASCVASASAAVAVVRTALRLGVVRDLELSVTLTWAMFGVACLMTAFAFTWRHRSSRSRTPHAFYPIFLSLLSFCLQAVIAAALLWLPCDEYCPISVAPTSASIAVEGERIILWSAFLLSVSTVVSVTTPYHAQHVFGRVAASLSIEIATLAALAVRWRVDLGVCLVAIAICVACHAIAVLSNVAFCNIERARFATECALRNASDDAARILNDLFPPHVVHRLVAGEAVEPTVSDGTVVLFCDLAGFTKMASSESAKGIMRAMNDVYSAFDRLVEEATLPDGAIWKVETVGDAYIVVAGALPLRVEQRLQPSDHPPIDAAAATLGPLPMRSDNAHLSGTATVTRSHLQRIFALALRMQDELAVLRRDLSLPLHARMGVHCGTVVSGIVGSQRPRFCVLGPAVIEAERTEAEGSSDRVSCSAEAQRVYLSSTFRFHDSIAGNSSVLLPPASISVPEGP